MDFVQFYLRLWSPKSIYISPYWSSKPYYSTTILQIRLCYYYTNCSRKLTQPMFWPLFVTNCFWKVSSLDKKVNSQHKKWFYYYFFPRLAEQNFKHKILGTKKLLTKIENYIYTYSRISYRVIKIIKGILFFSPRLRFSKEKIQN